MSKYFYFEPTSSFMTEYQVGFNIGSAAVTWHPSLQAEIGLYQAYQTPYPQNYGRFNNKVDGSTWVRKEPGEYLEFPFSAGNEYPVYVQEWSIVPLTGPEQTALTGIAQSVVATEMEARLSSLNAWASAKHIANTSATISNDIKTAINDLFALNSTADYPFNLADAVETGSFTGWPTRLTSLQIQNLIDPA